MLYQKFKKLSLFITQQGIASHYEPLLKKQLELTNFLLVFVLIPIGTVFFFLLKPTIVNISIISLTIVSSLIAFYSNIQGRTFSRIILSCLFPIIAFIVPFSLKWFHNPIEQYFPSFFNVRAVLFIGIGFTLILLNHKTERWTILGITVPTLFLFIFFKPYFEYALGISIDEIALYPTMSLSPTIGAYVVFILMLIYQIYVNTKFENKLITQRDKIYTQREEIITQNEELRQNQEEIVSQRDYIATQHEQLKNSSKRITDSIRYAKSIQQSILPEGQELTRLLKDYFIIYRPKDIVSGDFYWVHQTANQTALVMADCTGHGVPGAFMSMLGVSILNEIVEKQHDLTAHEVLEQLDERISKVLNQQNDNGNHDGMDIALCIWKTQSGDRFELQFAGAKQALYVVEDHQLTCVKGTRRSIGGYHFNKPAFETHVLTLNAGTTLYLSSDGYVDQNKQNSTKKVGTKTLQKLLLQYHTLPFTAQKQALEEYLDSYKQEAEQRDDITLIGFSL
ncbi:MAG: PP2C family protein-serine/threonine phosphatase [Flammeovirgaceae bacterium]